MNLIIILIVMILQLMLSIATFSVEKWFLPYFLWGVLFIALVSMHSFAIENIYKKIGKTGFMQALIISTILAFLSKADGVFFRFYIFSLFFTFFLTGFSVVISRRDKN